VVGCGGNVSAVRRAQSAKSLGIPMGKVVSTEAVGTVGTEPVQLDPATPDHNDLRVTVSPLVAESRRELTMIV
jgi:hypothetical protein